MKALRICIVLLSLALILAGQAVAADLSAITYQEWPAKVPRPALPPNAAEYLAPPGTVTFIMHSNGRADKGTNSAPMKVIADTVTLPDGSIVKVYYRKKSCGNPAGGSDIIFTPKPRPTYTPPPPPPACPPLPRVVNHQATGTGLLATLTPQAGPEALQTPLTLGYKNVTEKTIMGAFAYQAPAVVVRPPTNNPNCPPVGTPGNPQPQPVPPNSPKLPQYPPGNTHGTGGNAHDPSPSSPTVADQVQR